MCTRTNEVSPCERPLPKGEMKQLVLSFALVLSLGALCNADCCWDSDGYAIDGKEIVNRQSDPFWRTFLSERCDCRPEWSDLDNCDENYCTNDVTGQLFPQRYFCVKPGSPYVYQLGWGNVWYCKGLYSNQDPWWCLDGTLRVGSYCSVGKCNVFGCDCDGGCIQPGGKRRLMQAETNASSPGSSTPLGSGPLSLVGQCQEKMTKKYNTMSLQQPDQIRAYFDCLDSDGSGMLDVTDMSIKNMPINASVLASMDLNENGGIDSSEFDATLASSTPQSRTASGASGLDGALLVFPVVLVLLSLVT